MRNKAVAGHSQESTHTRSEQCGKVDAFLLYPRARRLSRKAKGDGEGPLQWRRPLPADERTLLGYWISGVSRPTCCKRLTVCRVVHNNLHTPPLPHSTVWGFVSFDLTSEECNFTPTKGKCSFKGRKKKHKKSDAGSKERECLRLFPCDI